MFVLFSAKKEQAAITIQAAVRNRKLKRLIGIYNRIEKLTGSELKALEDRISVPLKYWRGRALLKALPNEVRDYIFDNHLGRFGRYVVRGDLALRYFGITLGDEEEFFEFRITLDDDDYPSFGGAYYDVKWLCVDTNEAGVKKRVSGSSEFAYHLTTWGDDY